MATEAVRLSPSNEISRCITHYFAGPVMALNIHLISEPIPEGHVLLHLQDFSSGASSLLRLSFLRNFNINREPSDAIHHYLTHGFGCINEFSARVG